MDSLRRHVLTLSVASTVPALFGEAFRASGYAGRGRRWRRRSAEATTIIEIDSPPKSRSVGIDIGVWVPQFGGSEPAAAMACPVVVHMENLLLDDTSDGLVVARTLDSGSDMPDYERLQTIRDRAEAVSRYLCEISSLEALRRAYRKGELNSAFMTASARALITQASSSAADESDAEDQ